MDKRSFMFAKVKEHQRMFNLVCVYEITINFNIKLCMHPRFSLHLSVLHSSLIVYDKLLSLLLYTIIKTVALGIKSFRMVK